MRRERPSNAEINRWKSFIRMDEKLAISQSRLPASEFLSQVDAARSLTLEKGYHNQVDSYYGRVSMSLGRFKSDVGPEGMVLDWGCSKGFTTIELANIYDCKVIGIDVRGYLRRLIDHTLDKAKNDSGYLLRHVPPGLKSKIKVPKRLRLPSSFVMADGFKAPFSDGTFDAVYCMNNIYYVLAFMHRDVARQRMEQVSRLVKNGGHLIITGNGIGDADSNINSFIFRKRNNQLELVDTNLAGVWQDNTRIEMLAYACKLEFIPY